MKSSFRLLAPIGFQIGCFVLAIMALAAGDSTRSAVWMAATIIIGAINVGRDA